MTRTKIIWIVHDYILDRPFMIYKVITCQKHPDFTRLLVRDRWGE